MPSTPRVGQTRHAVKIPHVAPLTDQDHNANMRHLEQAINDLPLFAGQTATSTSDEVNFTAGAAVVTVPAPAHPVAGNLGALFVQVVSVDAAGPAFAYYGGKDSEYGFLLRDDGGGVYSGSVALPWYVVEDLEVGVEVTGATTGTLVVMYVYPV